MYAFHDPCVLGTYLNVLVRAEGQAEAYEAACRARREIERLDAVFNWRDPASEISQLNSAARFVASADLFAVVATAERWRELSHNAISGRVGQLLAAWRTAALAPADAARMASGIANANVRLDPATRTVTRPEPVHFDLDAIAKGYIIDRALDAAMTSCMGAMVDIGGDIACAGQGPRNGRWQIGLPDPLTTFDNAPSVGAFAMAHGAVATSGCGPRDIHGSSVRSATIDPRTGWPVAHQRSATIAATTAMEADALATIALVGDEAVTRACLKASPGAMGRITRPSGVDWFNAVAPEVLSIKYEAPQDDYKSGWPDGWIVSVAFTAPPKDMRRAIALRSPYVAIWVSDAERKTVRTLLLVGTIKEWQEYNHVWWRLNRGSTEKLLNGRSMSTRGSGLYKVYWDGVDDNGRPVKPGKYTLHVETSRERGEHTHRQLEIDFSTMRLFDAEMPVDPESGGLQVSMTKF
ncbi:MAG: DUF2271 domain-containing protein [Sphingomonadales bacterium]|nr:MAG: DUF2271 domain-containing protein [Sphingomonadales bacterium]